MQIAEQRLDFAHNPGFLPENNEDRVAVPFYPDNFAWLPQYLIMAVDVGEL